MLGVGTHLSMVMLLRPTSHRAHKGGKSICFLLQCGKMLYCAGGQTVPLPEQHMGWKHILYFQLFQHKHTAVLQNRRNSLLVVSNIKQWPPHFQISTSPHPDIWLDSRWVRFTFYNNNQTLDGNLVFRFSEQLVGWRDHSNIIYVFQCTTIVFLNVQPEGETQEGMWVFSHRDIRNLDERY